MLPSTGRNHGRDRLEVGPWRCFPTTKECQTLVITAGCGVTNPVYVDDHDRVRHAGDVVAFFKRRPADSCSLPVCLHGVMSLCFSYKVLSYIINEQKFWFFQALSVNRGILL